MASEVHDNASSEGEGSKADPITDPELVAAFARGDFAGVRARARALEGDPSASPARKAQARAALDRVSADVVVYGMLGFALVVFCAIVLRYVAH